MRIAVHGATGYQGRLVLAELARRGIEPVLIGRDAVRLEQAATSTGTVDAQRRLAAVDDPAALADAFRGCAAVVNCAGPFTPIGTAVISAALRAGSHYVDTAGEQLYVKRVFDELGEAAERAGVTVVPATNDACAPTDFTACLLAKRLGSLDEIATTHLIEGGAGPTRGSLRSLLATAEGIATGGLTYADGAWRTGVPARRRSVPLPGDGPAIEVLPFPMTEVVTIPRHTPVRHVEGLAEAALIARFTTPLTTEIIDTLPEGPSEDDRRSQRFTYLVDAVSPDGRRARGVVRGVDTYGTTAIIAVESAVRLAEDGARPGVLAPAEAYDPVDFLDSLRPHGLTWTIEPHPGDACQPS